MEEPRNYINVAVITEKIYTITGVKKHYGLGDMAYGEWLVYKNNKPCFYMNSFDDYYKEIKKDHLGLPFLEKKLKARGLTLNTNYWGMRSGKLEDEIITLPLLPKFYLQ